MIRETGRPLWVILIPLVVSAQLSGQIAVSSVTTSSTQAILQFTSPISKPCSIQVADMSRSVTIVSGSQTSGRVTIQTAAPHGLLAGGTVYLENTGVWDGWQVVATVPGNNSFTFASAATGTASSGNVGVLVDDVNPNLFPGADQDTRAGNVVSQPGPVQNGVAPSQAGRSRSFVIGKRASETASDGNKYSRALQANARHHYTLTCGAQSFDQEFLTANIPLGDTHNEGPPADRANPGQYAYPTIEWGNQAQTLIDPLSGLRSYRVTSPQGQPSTTQNFVTALDFNSVWSNPSGPLNNFSGMASFTAPCAAGTCPLFLRADSLVIPGGATYTAAGSSLDWFTVTISQAAIGNSACMGDDCKIVTCLTVNGVSCASANREISLTSAPRTYTVGTQNLMDLWQSSGAPPVSRVEASTASGTVNYNSATRQVTLAGGNPFSVRWAAGSRINVAGAEYSIASVQSELQLTLSKGPTSNLSGVPYSATNFGVLIWKKTNTADRVSIGYTTFLYGSSGMQPWYSEALEPNLVCSSATASSGSKMGYNCFVGQELFWMAADGSTVNDLGSAGFTYYGDNRWSTSNVCAGNFDPQNADAWYCLIPLFFDSTRMSLVQVKYIGSHNQGVPGKLIPDCSFTTPVNTPPCNQFTILQPNKSDSVSQAAPLFNPDYLASGYTAQFWLLGGVSLDGNLMIYTRMESQDTPGWSFIYDLGDRTPAGTTSNSVHIVAGASSYRKAPASWCSIHAVQNPDSGWASWSSNDLTISGPRRTYTTFLTSARLTNATGGSGGLNACPSNSFGVSGQKCTQITVTTGMPQEQAAFTALQSIQPGDLMTIDSEYVRVLQAVSATQYWVQRGYNNTLAAHPNTAALVMVCGTRNIQNAAVTLWNYRADPFGTNSAGTTVIPDPNILNAHSYIAGGVSVVEGGFSFVLGESLCPSATGGSCLQIRQGNIATAYQSPQSAVEINPPFGGVSGNGVPNFVDGHPGPCFSGVCMDARPLLGGGISLGSSTSPFTNVSGQLWKIGGAQSVLNRKNLTTLAYSGRHPLVDVSGPGSLLGNGATDSYKYCYALAAGECQSGSAAGDVYVNTPYVSVPYCSYPGIAIQPDDTNRLCIADLGAYTANIVQFGITRHDISGAGFRRLGSNYGKWNQFDVFWNNQGPPAASVSGSQVRWLDGVRFDNLINILPPYPNQDTVTRGSFEAIPVAVDPPPQPGKTAIVEFGYAENGSAANYYCTSRQEACVAVSAAVNTAAPFYFEQTEHYSGVPCSSGCTVTIPALPQHVVYYRWKYLDASSHVIGTSQPHVTVAQ